jgi:hypothetical protein
VTQAASQTLPLGRLTPGMRLAEPIHDRQGKLLFASARTLSEADLSQLRQQAIAAASILLDTDAQRRHAEERLDRIFRKTLDQPASRKLHDLILDYRLEGLK